MSKMWKRMMEIAGWKGMALAAFLCCASASAIESDPFVVRDSIRADAGPVITARILAKLDATLEALARRPGTPTEDEVAALFRKKAGGGFAITYFEMGLNWSKDVPAASRQRVRMRDSVLRSAALARPDLYFGPMARTIRAYGIEAGTDKYGHALQQGYDYYKTYRKALAAGASEEQATASAVRFGAHTEETYWGNYVSGVYSNADLAANFSGLRFYQNLTHSVRVGGRERAAILVLDGQGKWRRNPEIADAELFGAFVSEHWDELANPSVYIPYMDQRVRAVVASRCDAWRSAHPGSSFAAMKAKEHELRAWFGEDYGFKGEDGRVMSLAEICFSSS